MGCFYLANSLISCLKSNLIRKLVTMYLLHNCCLSCSKDYLKSALGSNSRLPIPYQTHTHRQLYNTNFTLRPCDLLSMNYEHTHLLSVNINGKIRVFTNNFSNNSYYTHYYTI